MALSPAPCAFATDWTLLCFLDPGYIPFALLGTGKVPAPTSTCPLHIARLSLVNEKSVHNVLISAPGSHSLMEQPCFCYSLACYSLLAFSGCFLAAELQPMLTLEGIGQLAHNNIHQLCSSVSAQLCCTSLNCYQKLMEISFILRAVVLFMYLNG